MCHHTWPQRQVFIYCFPKFWTEREEEGWCGAVLGLPTQAFSVLPLFFLILSSFLHPNFIKFYLYANMAGQRPKGTMHMPPWCQAQTSDCCCRKDTDLDTWVQFGLCLPPAGQVLNLGKFILTLAYLWWWGTFHIPVQIWLKIWEKFLKWNKSTSLKEGFYLFSSSTPREIPWTNIIISLPDNISMATEVDPANPEKENSVDRGHLSPPPSSPHL
jgi:hypothetical protein